LSGRRQRLGDIAAGTIVILTPKLTQPDVAQLMSGQFNSLAEHRHLASRLRHKAIPQVAPFALEALLRTDPMHPPPRLKLFGEFAAYFRSLVAFPEEVLEQISDEQYVRDAVEIFFQQSAHHG